jgi:LuxR family maltose regulon positive regulatory protein
MRSRARRPWSARPRLELRAADLRFSPDEARAFLNQVMGLNLSPDHVTALETRTEGWAPGLQLAALSLRSQEDPAQFIAAFTGSHRFVLDYLVEEVLNNQPDDVRQFLLDTSVLRELTGPLCDALTGRTDGSQTLEELERGNLFVVPLDDQRQWYRYHHLFADALRSRLLSRHPDRGLALHRAACSWYAKDATCRRR